VTLEIDARQASLNFTVSLDADNVATLSFAYDMRPLWVDDAHLDSKHGKKVFDHEKMAVRHLVCLANQDDGDDDKEADDHDDFDRETCGEDDEGHEGDGGAIAAGTRPSSDAVWTPGMWNASERAALDKECDLIANLLVKADELLARLAIQDAKDTPIRDPDQVKEVQHAIANAEKELARASHEWEQHEYDDAIQHFKHAWKHAQHAIEKARR